MIFSLPNACASSVRDNSNNYGVNKKEININDSNMSNILSTPMVDASLKIYDNAEILSETDEAYLYDLIQEFISETNMDMVILTDDKAYYNDSQNETYATDFYDYNDFGLNFDKYSGVLLYRNAYEVDPYYNVYMFGNAQLYFDYNRSEEMLDTIYSNMKVGNYVPAFEKFITMYKRYYNEGIPSSKKNYYVDEMGFLQKNILIHGC